MDKPANCDICARPFTTTYIDGATIWGPWGNMCPQCHASHGIGFGVGRGQMYDAKTGEKIPQLKA